MHQADLNDIFNTENKLWIYAIKKCWVYIKNKMYLFNTSRVRNNYKVRELVFEKVDQLKYLGTVGTTIVNNDWIKIANHVSTRSKKKLLYIRTIF